MKDLHYCGNKDKPTEDEACFPTLVGMIRSIHCEMHICEFERNQAPAKELSLEESSLPANNLGYEEMQIHVTWTLVMTAYFLYTITEATI